MIDLDDIRQDIFDIKTVPKVLYVYRGDTFELDLDLTISSSELNSVVLNCDGLPEATPLTLLETTAASSKWHLLLNKTQTLILAPKNHNFTITIVRTDGTELTLYKGIMTVNNRVYSNYSNNYYIATLLKQTVPTVSDNDYLIGTMWVNVLTNRVYFLTSVVNDEANWIDYLEQLDEFHIQIDDMLDGTIAFTGVKLDDGNGNFATMRYTHSNGNHYQVVDIIYPDGRVEQINQQFDNNFRSVVDSVLNSGHVLMSQGVTQGNQAVDAKLFDETSQDAYNLLGVVTVDGIAKHSKSKATRLGIVTGIQTFFNTGVAYEEGQTLWARQGLLSNVAPAKPGLQVRMGVLINTQGSMDALIFPYVFGKFVDNSDVDMTGIQEGDVIERHGSLYKPTNRVTELEATRELLENKAEDFTTINQTKYPTTQAAKAELDKKVDKILTIIGLDLQNNILLDEFRIALGNATQIFAGLMSPQDKAHLDGLIDLFEADGDNVVNTIAEVLTIFNNYPEGADLVSALAGKVDKVEGKQLSTNDLTNILKDNYDTAYSHSQITDKSNPHNTSFQNLTDKPTTRDGFGITDVYKKEDVYNKQETLNTEEIEQRLTDHFGEFGIEDTNLTPTPLTNGQSILRAALTDYNKVLFVCRELSSGKLDTDLVFTNEIAEGTIFDFFDNPNVIAQVTATEIVFTTIAGYTLQINATKNIELTAEHIRIDPSGTVFLSTTLKGIVEETSEKFKDVKSDLALKVDKATDTFDITRKTVNDITAKYENEIITGSKTNLKKVLGKSAHLRNIYGPRDLQIEGRTIPALDNLVENGDFSDGTTGWTLHTVTGSVTSKIISFTATEQYGNIANEIPIINGNVYYYKVKLKSDTSNIRIYFNNADNNNYVSPSGSGSFEILTNSLIATTSTNITIVDFRSSAWTQIDVDYAMAFNLTASHGVTDTSGTAYDNAVAEIEEMLELNGGYISSIPIHAVSMNKRVRSVGKNLFDKTLTYTKTNMTQRDYVFTQITADTSEVLNWKVQKVQNSALGSILSSYANSNIGIINLSFTKTNSFNGIFFGLNGSQRDTGIFINVSNLTNDSVYTIQVNLINATQGTIAWNNVQLEYGSTATTYEPYVSSDLFLQANKVGYKLPNGVADTIEYRNGKYYFVQRVQEYTLQANDITELITSDDDTDRVNTIAFPLRVIDNNSNTNMFINGWEMVSTSAIDYLPVNIGKYGFGAGSKSSLLWFIVAKGTYADLATTKTALTGTVIYYQLATPIETEIEVTGEILKSPNVTYYIEDWDFVNDQPAAPQSVMSRVQLPLLSLDTVSRVTNVNKTDVVEVVDNIYKHWNSSVMLDLEQLVGEKQIPAATKVAYETWLEANTTLKVGDYFDEFKHDLKLRKYKSISENLLPQIPEMPADINTPVDILKGKTLKEVFEDNNMIPSFDTISNWVLDNVVYNNSLFTFNATNNLAFIISKQNLIDVKYLTSNDKLYYNYEVIEKNTYLNIGDISIISLTLSQVVDNEIGRNSHIAYVKENGSRIDFRVNVNPTNGHLVMSDSIYVINTSYLGIDNLTKEQMDYWYNVYDYLKNNTQMTVLKSQIPVKASTKLNFGYNGTPTELRMEYLDCFDNVISSEVKTSFLGTAYKYGNFTVPATAVKVNAYIKPSEPITQVFTKDLKAFIKFDEVNGSTLANPNKYMWTPYEEDVITFNQTLRSAIDGSVGKDELDLENLSLVKKIKDVGLDTPITELNNHTLREVFEGGNGFISYYLGNNAISINTRARTNFVLVSAGDFIYCKTLTFASEGLLNDYLNDNVIDYPTSSPVSLVINYKSLDFNDKIEMIDNGSFVIDYKKVDNAVFDLSVDLQTNPYIINLTALGISSLTVEEMDYWFGIYQALQSEATVPATIEHAEVTPIPAQDFDAIVYNYGMELFELESELIGDVIMSYYRDTATQVDTNASLIEDILARLAALEDLH